AAGAYTHNRPSGLGRSAWANSFGRWIFVRATSFTPAAVVVLAALEPVAPAQNPVLSHIFADCPQAAPHLPCAIDVIHSPSSVPQAILILNSDHISDRIVNACRVAIEPDVSEQLERSRSHVTAGGIENRIVIRKRHIFQPRSRHVLVEGRPAAIATLETELPPKRATKKFLE